ncbi:acyl-CoA synthetase [Paraconexibacter algicola]|uniref:Acyl-CoA synthetase n=1 Tax=Paraconexibacter algicola TaxID=2133960 RepID=A0A2T4UJA7_9ACTN|nr:acyl-CoA synthetase [Paraconexibacter algicola]PTL59318.1 acyl-CoA synthetase [Paraconexibacter algicola]
MAAVTDLLARVPAPAARVATRIGNELFYANRLREVGMLHPQPPHKTAKAVSCYLRYGLLGGSIAAVAQRVPDAIAIRDERGEMTYAELDAASNALANHFRERGLGPGDGVALLARNHRGFVIALFAGAKAGVRLVLLNTDFAGPQIREVAGREGTDLLIHDDEYSAFLEGLEPRAGRLRAWTDEPADDTIDAVVARSSTAPPPRVGAAAKLIVLTSGTTGTPKGAPRPTPKSLILPGSLVGRIPFKGGETTVIGPPIFHALGLAHVVLGVGLGSTLVLRRKFDPEQALRDLAEHRASAFISVPIMLTRMLEVDPAVRESLDLSALRIVFVGGSQLGGELCRRTTKAFGPVVYNLYGSTEVAYATVATPEELAIAPDCVGRSPRGTTVRLYDEQRELITEPHVTGRIFVSNGFAFEGYTGGGGKEVIDGHMATGDVGHVDEHGLLFIDGRDDDMIVSGGENVFPAEVEELLHSHPKVAEASVIGVDDETFGKRLRAFVALLPGEEATEEEFKSLVKENLARYKVPREVVFLDTLPRNPTGKVLKRKLAEYEA